jgi:uncharacterized protein (DUF427 family)
MRKLFTAGAAQSVEANQDIRMKVMTVTAAAADVTVVVNGAGVAELKLNVKAGETQQYIHPGPEGLHLTAPSTIDITGAAAFVRIDA